MSTTGIERDVTRRFSAGRAFSVARLVLDAALQPIVETATERVFGYESLMRGFDRAGFASPVELLDHAQESGYLAMLEQMLASRALAKFSSLPDFSSGTLFLNLDVRLIAQGNAIVDALVSQLAKAGIAHSSICFELSERFDNTRVPEFHGLVTRLRKEGFKLAIDDFGVGHGEIKLLCDFAVDYLKIDRHFIDGLDRNPRKRHLIRNIVNIAHVLGVRVIAEGIETEAEFLVCREYGVDLAQGWFIARPTTRIDELGRGFAHLQRLRENRSDSRTLDEILIRRQIEKVPAVQENDGIDKVLELFRRNPQRAFFPVLNANGEPRGIINEYHMREYIYQPFGRELLKNKDYERTISHFVDLAPVVEIDAGADRLMNIFASMDGNTCVIMTENMRYAGVVSAAALIKITNEKQLKIAQDQNPLTALPGNRAIVNFIDDNCHDSHAVRFFCYCDLDNFKPFNDKYGFHIGDHAISLFAALMRRYFFAGSTFLGHIGGDDFFIGVRDSTREEVRETLERLLKDFRHDAIDLYSEEDRIAGRIKGNDRFGQERYFALLSCSIAVLELPKGLKVEDSARVGAEIAAVKNDAKESQTGLVLRVLGEAA